jgi:acyl dehydratase
VYEVATLYTFGREGQRAGGAAPLDTPPQAALIASDGTWKEKTMLSSAALHKSDKRKIDAADLERLIGQEVGVSDWTTLDQAKIDAFAELTFDPYFIHTDPERAKRETPFGSTIAHGFLTLSMLSAMAYDALPDIVGRTMGMNYGFDKIRFISPVPAGSRIRGRFKISHVTRKTAQAVVRYAVSIEVEGKDKPALAAEWLTIAFLE